MLTLSFVNIYLKIADFHSKYVQYLAICSSALIQHLNADISRQKVIKVIFSVACPIYNDNRQAFV